MRGPPLGSTRRRFRFSTEIGYAPETPTNAGVELSGDGDTDGLAWAVTASFMDFFDNHSIGLNYARTEAGWLLSPQYNKNEQLAEIRYVWVPNERLTVDTRLRRREELEMLIGAEQKRKEYDLFVRLTWRFRKDRG